MKIYSTFNLQLRTPNPERLAGRRHSKLGVECSLFGVSPSAGNPHSAICNPQSERGIALVITLILLSVTLIMAVAFLHIANRERNAVNTTTDTTVARLATDTALSAAQAQIVASVLANNAAAYNFHLLVSTNFINQLGFDGNSYPGSPYGSPNPTNVNYDYTLAGNALSPDQRNQNIANLWLLPRAPVLTTVDTNDPAGRFYLDLNRNGQFDGNQLLPVISTEPNNPYFDTNGNPTAVFSPPNILSNVNIGDPEWIGVLEHPDQPHGPNNPFVARYAFVAQPVGNGLDLNYIHNQTENQSLSASDGYFRNEGVGSWELNLAAFLADLNTNQWGQAIGAPSLFYQYNEPGGFNNIGSAFDDARALLSWRYNYNYNLLALAPPNVFGLANAGLVDTYTVGNLMTNTYLPLAGVPGPLKSWAGSANTNQFFALPSELFDPTKSSTFFVNRLASTGTSNSTYDRYTFYRLLDEVGTGSTADDNRMNLNYDNLDANGNVVPGSETNAFPWTALRFYTNAADRLLRAYTANWFAANPTNFLVTYYHYYPTTTIQPNGQGMPNLAPYFVTNQVPAFGFTNIPVYVNGQFVYSPAVNRLLQLAVNMYDASTNVAALSINNGINYPSVFRPIFNVVPNGVYRDIFITSFGYVSSVSVPPAVDLRLSTPFAVETIAATVSSGPVPPNDNIYGVPWIIGAKKGFPAFNQLSMVNSSEFERLLEVGHNVVDGPVTYTNQMVTMTVNNTLGVSFWNSYSNDYVGSGNLTVYVASTNVIYLTNSVLGSAKPFIFTFGTNMVSTFNRWPGSKWGANGSGLPQASSFIATVWTNNLVPGWAYNFASGGFLGTNVQLAWDPTLSPLPQFGMLTTNSLQAYILDGTHVIDYVQLRGPIDQSVLNNSLQDPGPNYKGGSPYYLWSTNVAGNGTVPSYGIVNQMIISTTPVNPPPPGKWNNPPITIPGLDSVTASRDFFAAAFTPSHSFIVNGITYSNNQFVSQAPFTADRMVFVPYLYQVNDPLVHYLASDLNAGAGAVWANTSLPNGVWTHSDSGSVLFPNPPTTSIVNGRYQPWSKTAPTALLTGSYYFSNPNYYITYKDPLVWAADFWDFPTNQYPTVGWLGRVHRGTPWQTVYLKATDVSSGNVGINTWSAWSGDTQLTYGQYFDAANSAPVQDRELFDLFSTSLAGNATRGTLSVNVGAGNPGPTAGLAAWSALFSGLVTLSNSAPNASVASTSLTYTNWIINPAGVAGVNSALGYLVTNINFTRSAFVNADGVAGVFERKGDILSVPALTEQSPFLNLATVQKNSGISDELYEWLPQQTLGLLRASPTPRYVVYCYGQTLRPAQNAFVTASGPFFGLCTNYQITAESSARAVIRVDQHVTATGTTNYSSVIESFNPLPPN